jgi:aminoglycoside phosphotransferase (APT) family kinase protein
MSAELADRLGDDLAALVAQVGGRLCEVTPVSRRGPSNDATVFRLRFADGQVCKGSHLNSDEHAARVAMLSAALGAGAPDLLGCRGAALLCEWVEGSTLTAEADDESLLRACGAWQARVHCLQPGDGGVAVHRLANRRRRLTSELAELGASGLLDGAELAALADLVARHAPAQSEAGIILGDLCPENLVRRPSGELCLIDVETIDLAPVDYDLGRTWYRWPMTASQRAMFLDGYRQHRDPAPFLTHRPFWLLAALASGAAFRQLQRAAEVGVPLAGLRALARRPDLDPTTPA